MDRQESDRLADVVMACGRIMLESGGEVYRVEETMRYICLSFPQASDPQAVATPTSITFTFEADGHHTTRVCRIRERTIDLHKVAMVNDLSRRARNMSLGAMERMVEKIEHEPTYPRWVSVLSASLCAVGFGILFDCQPYVLVLIFLIGIIGGTIITLPMNSILRTLLAVFVMTEIPIILHHFFPTLEIDWMIVSLMTELAPGLAIVDAIRDTIAGDYVAGVARGLEALLVAMVIAAGMAVAMVVHL